MVAFHLSYIDIELILFVDFVSINVCTDANCCKYCSGDM